jgi:hypothetical protein
MARQTSIDCYNQIEAEGLLSKLRLIAYHAMLNAAPCTAGELQEYIDAKKLNVKHAWKLLSQLRDLGVVYERSERPCKVTSRNVIEWDLTDKLPIYAKVFTNSKKDRVNNTLDALRELYKNKNTSTDEDWKNIADLIKSI